MLYKVECYIRIFTGKMFRNTLESEKDNDLVAPSLYMHISRSLNFYYLYAPSRDSTFFYIFITKRKLASVQLAKSLYPVSHRSTTNSAVVIGNYHFD